MQTAKQISVPLVNKPGRLVTVMEALTKEKVVFRASCVMDSGTRGTLRFVPKDHALACAALDAISVGYDLADVLLVEAPNRGGGLPKIWRRLAEAHLNVDYAYGSLTSPGGAKGGSLAVIRVNDLVKAQRILSEGVMTNGDRPKKRPGRRPTFAR